MQEQFMTSDLWETPRIESVWKSQNKLKFDVASMTTPQISINVFLLTTRQGNSIATTISPTEERTTWINVSYIGSYDETSHETLVLCLQFLAGLGGIVLSVLMVFKSDFSSIWKSSFYSVQTHTGYLTWCKPQETNVFCGRIYSLKKKTEGKHNSIL